MCIFNNIFTSFFEAKALFALFYVIFLKNAKNPRPLKAVGNNRSFTVGIYEHCRFQHGCLGFAVKDLVVQNHLNSFVKRKLFYV